MKVGIVSTAVPLVRGGGRFIGDWLREKLLEAGHEADIVYIPYVDEPDRHLPKMAMLRLLRLDGFERVITLRPPAHVVRHPRKVCWFIHHVRMFYDLWGTPYCPTPDDARGRALRASIIEADTAALAEAHRVFTNSRVVADRLLRFNGIAGEVLYPPILRPDAFTAGEHGDEVVSICRMEHHKRQHLLVEALAHARSPVRLRLCGASMDPGYAAALADTARRLGVAERVTLDARWITEDEKAALLGRALAAAYAPFDEDSYGYPTIEAAHAARATLTTTDAGGVPEFVLDGVTGLVTEPDPAALGAAFDRLHEDRALARRLGAAARARVGELGIDWATVLAKLLG